jgi:anti-sigma factor RsiW
MERQEFGDETLMAYADGELDAETARAVAAAAANDAKTAQRIAMFSRTRDILGEVARARPLEPLSPELGARVEETLRAAHPAPSETVVSFPRRTVAAPAYRPMAAAALALAVGVAGGYLVSQTTGARETGGLGIAALEVPGISNVLDTLPSGERVTIADGEVAAIASFLNADGELCREFEVDWTSRDTVVSVACWRAEGWVPRLAIVAPTADETGYAPASSLETIDAYLGAIGAGAPLTLEEEAAALRALGG